MPITRKTVAVAIMAFTLLAGTALLTASENMRNGAVCGFNAYLLANRETVSVLTMDGTRADLFHRCMRNAASGEWR